MQSQHLLRTAAALQQNSKKPAFPAILNRILSM